MSARTHGLVMQPAMRILPTKLVISPRTRFGFMSNSRAMEGEKQDPEGSVRDWPRKLGSGACGVASEGFSDIEELDSHRRVVRRDRTRGETKQASSNGGNQEIQVGD